MNAVNPRLIADIGASEGNDTQYYLRKGFDVVALEADPVVFASLQKRFADDVTRGAVTLVNRVAAETSGDTVQFWRNTRYQGLSTFDPERAQFREHLVPYTAQTANWNDIIALRGVPYYCKLDIEGGETRFLRSMRGAGVYPNYLSAECHTFEPVALMFELGYRRFKFVNQKLVGEMATIIPDPPLEGNHVPDPDWTHASGPFGRELPDRWLSFQEAAVVFDMIVRLKGFFAVLMPCWFDCHAAWG